MARPLLFGWVVAFALLSCLVTIAPVDALKHGKGHKEQDRKRDQITDEPPVEQNADADVEEGDGQFNQKNRAAPSYYENAVTLPPLIPLTWGKGFSDGADVADGGDGGDGGNGGGVGNTDTNGDGMSNGGAGVDNTETSAGGGGGGVDSTDDTNTNAAEGTDGKGTDGDNPQKNQQGGGGNKESSDTDPSTSDTDTDADVDVGDGAGDDDKDASSTDTEDTSSKDDTQPQGDGITDAGAGAGAGDGAGAGAGVGGGDAGDGAGGDVGGGDAKADTQADGDGGTDDADNTKGIFYNGRIPVVFNNPHVAADVSNNNTQQGNVGDNFGEDLEKKDTATNVTSNGGVVSVVGVLAGLLMLCVFIVVVVIRSRNRKDDECTYLVAKKGNVYNTTYGTGLTMLEQDALAMWHKSLMDIGDIGAEYSTIDDDKPRFSEFDLARLTPDTHGCEYELDNYTLISPNAEYVPSNYDNALSMGKGVESTTLTTATPTTAATATTTSPEYDVASNTTKAYDIASAKTTPISTSTYDLASSKYSSTSVGEVEGGNRGVGVGVGVGVCVAAEDVYEVIERRPSATSYTVPEHVSPSSAIVGTAQATTPTPPTTTPPPPTTTTTTTTTPTMSAMFEPQDSDLYDDPADSEFAKAKAPPLPEKDYTPIRKLKLTPATKPPTLPPRAKSSSSSSPLVSNNKENTDDSVVTMGDFSQRLKRACYKTIDTPAVITNGNVVTRLKTTSSEI